MLSIWTIEKYKNRKSKSRAHTLPNAWSVFLKEQLHCFYKMNRASWHFKIVDEIHCVKMVKIYFICWNPWFLGTYFNKLKVLKHDRDGTKPDGTKTLGSDPFSQTSIFVQFNLINFGCGQYILFIFQLFQFKDPSWRRTVTHGTNVLK